MVYLDVAAGLTDFAWLLLLRLPLVFFAIGLLHPKREGRPALKPFDCLLLPIASLAVSSAVTVGLGLLCWVVLPSFLDLSFLGFLAPLSAPFEVWVNSGLVWFVAFVDIAESLAYPLQFAFLFSSFSLLLWLPTVAGAKAVEKIRRRGQTTFTVQPPYATYTNELPITPPKITYHTQTAGPEQIPESRCETPRPLETFLATDGRDAGLQARSHNLIALYKEVDRWNLYGRRRVYWMLKPETAEKLLKLTVDMAAETEFDERERPVVNDLLGKRWLKKMKTGDKVYVYGLDRETAQVLQRQLTTLARRQSNSEPEIAEK